jgi:hypothetical protein
MDNNRYRHAVLHLLKLDQPKKDFRDSPKYGIPNSQPGKKTTATSPGSWCKNTDAFNVNSVQAPQKIGLHILKEPVSCHVCHPQCTPRKYVRTMKGS